MSRCRRTSTVLDAALAGVDLTTDESEHVAACAECAHAIAGIRRFDGELARIGHQLTPELLPPSAELSADRWQREDGRSMTLRRGMLATGVVVMSLAMAFGIASGWLGTSAGGLFGAGDHISVDDLNAWLDRAFVEVVAETGRPADPADWEPTRVEVCGRTALAFWAESDGDGARAYRWALGEPMSRLATVREGGLAASPAQLEVARLRAELPMCQVVIDMAPSRGQALAALDAARERWEREWGLGFTGRKPILETDELAQSTVVAVTSGAPQQFWVMLERPNRAGVSRVLMSDDEAAFRVEGSIMLQGGMEPFAVYVDSSEPNAHLYGAIPDGDVRAFELIGPGGTLRYPVAAPGFILDATIDLEAFPDYRFLDGRGEVVATGKLDRTCGFGSVESGVFGPQAEIQCAP